MTRIGDQDLERVDRFLGSLYACREIELFPTTVLTGLSRLVGADQVTWNEIDPSIARVSVHSHPEVEHHEVREDTLSRLIGEHPLLQHYLSTGDPSAVKVSDFLSEDAFHGTRLYGELYRWLDNEDHFVIHLGPPAPTDRVVLLARGARTFTEHDRELLNRVRPHIAQAYRTARAFHRLRRRLEERVASAARQSRMRIGPGMQILEYPARARRWVHAYFGTDFPRAPGRLPSAIASWLEVQDRGIRHPPLPPLVRQREGRRLSILAEPGADAGTWLLYLEESVVPSSGVPRLQRLGLTTREAQVLLQVDRGLTNLEIAADLGISVNTVKRHLEHIFDKLGVRTRIAAVGRLRDGGGPESRSG